MEDCPNREFQEAIQILVKCFRVEEEKDGQLKNGPLKSKIDEFKMKRKQRREMKGGQRKRNPDKKCNDIPPYCRMVGMAIRRELGKEEESEDDECE